jgi:cobalt-zinc-cadmium efflux system membrane fusion protein
VVFGRYGNYLEARPLELGRSDGKMIEVLEGLSAGEKYAGGNSFAIKAELGKSGASHDH